MQNLQEMTAHVLLVTRTSHCKT